MKTKTRKFSQAQKKKLKANIETLLSVKGFCPNTQFNNMSLKKQLAFARSLPVSETADEACVC